MSNSTDQPDSTDPTTETPDLPSGVTEFPAGRTDRLSATQRSDLAAAKGPSRASRLLVVIPVALVLVLLVAAAIAFQASRDTTGAPVPDSSVAAHMTKDFGVLRGDADAPVRVVVYEDFLCPACLNFEEAHGSNIDLLVNEGVVSVEYRMLSFLDRASTTDYSTRAMHAYLIVVGDGLSDAGEQFRKTLFLNQPAEGGPGLSDADLVEIAVNLGADRDEMERSQEGLLLEAYILNANDAASKDGVNQTPTVLVDGEALENPFTDFVPVVLDAAKAAGVDVDALTGDSTPTDPASPVPGTQQPEKDTK